MAATLKSICKGLATSYTVINKSMHGLMHGFYLEVGTAYLAEDGRAKRSAFKAEFVAAMDGYVTASKAEKMLTASQTVGRLVSLGFLDGEKIADRPVGHEGALIAIWNGLKTQPDAMLEVLKAKRGRADKAMWLSVDDANAIAKPFKDPNGTTGNRNGRSKKNAKARAKSASGSALVAGTEGSFSAVIKNFGEGDDAKKLEIAEAFLASTLPANVEAFGLLCEEFMSERVAVEATV